MTRCALNADFTQNYTDGNGINFQTLSSFVNECNPNPGPVGAGPWWSNATPALPSFPGHFFLYQAYDGPNGPYQTSLCSRLSITTDPQYGGQTLLFTFTCPGDCNTAGIHQNGDWLMGLQWPVGYQNYDDSDGGIVGLPNEMYVGIKFWYPPATESNGYGYPNGGGTIMDFWNGPYGFGGPEIDFTETVTSTNGNALTTNGAYGNSDPGPGCCAGYARQYYINGTNLHEVEFLTTSNETDDIVQCMARDGQILSCGSSYIDNRLNLCYGTQPSGPSDPPCDPTYHEQLGWSQRRNALVLWFGDWGSSSSPGAQIYIHSITLWECSGYQTGTCPGTVIRCNNLPAGVGSCQPSGTILSSLEDKAREFAQSDTRNAIVTMCQTADPLVCKPVTLTGSGKITKGACGIMATWLVGDWLKDNLGWKWKGDFKCPVPE